MANINQSFLHPSLPPEIAHDYEIVRLLGRGGMGEVYLGRQLRVGGRFVALKVINPFLTSDPEMIRRFENEAALAGRLNHENIAKIYDCRIAGNEQICVAMEYIEGQSLRALIDDKGALPIHIVIEIAKQICLGLSAIHRLGIIHRDIKADNIMIAQEGDRLVVKLLDFGIARLTTSDTSLTSSGVILGSAAYMSPEQAEGLNGDSIDARADIYSLGMVVYKMLTGQVAFGGGSWTNIVYKQVHEQPTPLRELRPDIAPAIEKVVLKALEKERSKRQQTAQEFSDELNAAYQESGIGTADRKNYSVNGIGGFMDKQQVNVVNIPSPRLGGIKKKTLKKITIGVIIGVIVAVIGYYINEVLKGGIWTAKTPITSLVEYRVKPEKLLPDFDTLAPGNRVHSGDYLSLQIKLTHPGSIYLLQESRDGSLKWMNATANNQAQIGREGEWLRIPDEENDWIEVQKTSGPERFLLLYVPIGVNWSLVQAAYPQSLTLKNGFPTISPDAASKIQEYVKSNGVEMSLSTSQSGRIVSHELLAPDTRNQIAFHKLKLEYEP